MQLKQSILTHGSEFSFQYPTAADRINLATNRVLAPLRRELIKIVFPVKEEK